VSVEVKNLQSGETFEVGPDGSTFGREGGPANIRVADPSVSKRHARIFAEASGWFLEDLNSVNGTVVDGGKIGAPVPLKPGLVFQMSKQRFEVIAIDGRSGARPPGAPAAAAEQETRTSMRQGPANALPSELRKDPIPRKREKPPPRLTDEEPLPPGEVPAAAPAKTTAQLRGKHALQPASDGDLPSAPYGDLGARSAFPAAAEDGWEAVGVGGAFFEGLAYALKTAPALVVRPLATTRQHIEAPPLPAVQQAPLVALLAPTMVAAAVMPAVASALAMALAGATAVEDLVLGPLLATLVGVLAAAVTGFAGHPVLSFLIGWLGGTADARARTTHLAQGAVAVSLVALAVALSALLAALTARLAPASPTFHLIVVVPALLGLVAWPAPLLVQWSWFKSYDAAKWFQTLLLIGAVLSLLAGGAVGVGAIAAGITALQATNAAVGSAASAAEPPADASSQPSSQSPPDGAAPPDAGSADGASPRVGSAGERLRSPAAAAGTAAEDRPGVRNAVGAASAAAPETPPSLPPGGEPSSDPTGPSSEPPPTSTAATPPTRGATSYAEYARKRARIEAVLESDPTLLKDPGIAARYKELSSATWKAEQAAEEAGYVGQGRRRSRDPSLNAYVEKVKRAKVYEATTKIVDALYKALGNP
jgi:hypothetical protein